MYQLRDINGNIALETSTVAFPSEVINGGPLLPNTYMYPLAYKPSLLGDNLVTLGSNTWQLENGNYLKFEHVFSPHEQVILTFSTVPDFSTQRIYLITPVDSSNDFIGLVFYPDSSSPKIVGLLLHQDGTTPYNPNRWLLINITYGEPYGEMWDLLFNGYEQDWPTGDAAGGQGQDDDHSEDIPVPDLPSVGILTTGVWNPYSCTAIEMATIMTDFWDDSVITALKKMFDDPFDSVVSAGILPFNTAPYASSQSSQIKAGNTTMPHATARAITREWIELSGGVCDIRERWGSFCDYGGSVEIYIPFCGYHTLDIQEVMNSQLSLKYHINLLTGDLVALLKVTKYVNKQISKLDSVLYQFNGNCLVTIPITGANYNQRYAAMLTAAGNAIGAVTGGIGAAANGGAKAATLSAVGSASSMMGNAISGAYKTQIQRSGSPSPQTDFGKVLRAHLTFHRSVPNVPLNYDILNGRPSVIGTNSKWLNGYVEIQTAKLDGINCTDEERSMIAQALHEGSYF